MSSKEEEEEEEGEQAAGEEGKEEGCVERQAAPHFLNVESREQRAQEFKGMLLYHAVCARQWCPLNSPFIGYYLYHQATDYVTS